MKGILYAFSASKFDRNEVENMSEQECKMVWENHLHDELFEDKTTGLELPTVDSFAFSDGSHLQNWLNDECVNSYWVRIF